MLLSKTWYSDIPRITEWVTQGSISYPRTEQPGGHWNLRHLHTAVNLVMVKIWALILEPPTPCVLKKFIPALNTLRSRTVCFLVSFLQFLMYKLLNCSWICWKDQTLELGKTVFMCCKWPDPKLWDKIQNGKPGLKANTGGGAGPFLHILQKLRVGKVASYSCFWFIEMG